MQMVAGAGEGGVVGGPGVGVDQVEHGGAGFQIIAPGYRLLFELA
ncbi:MAG: hypothetical protein ACLFUU_10160 [Desulfobacteraceae bacterium]